MSKKKHHKSKGGTGKFSRGVAMELGGGSEGSKDSHASKEFHAANAKHDMHHGMQCGDEYEGEADDENSEHC